MPWMVVGDVASLCRLPMWGVDVDGLPCPLHHPTAGSHQMRGQSFLSGATFSHCAAVGGGTLPWGANPLGLDIRWNVDRLGTCVTDPYME
jgi:hypothetical protein